jgi:hypothetical protein
MIAVPPAATATTVATVNNGFPRANAVMAMFSLCLLSVPKTPLPNSGPLPPCATQRMDGTFLLRCRNKRLLQLTGVLVDRSGKAVRIGAEGFYARRTRLTVSAIGGQEVIGDEDLIAAAVVRRDDLPGAPLAWQVAIRELVTRLTGRS